jgi:hypothetical protein
MVLQKGNQQTFVQYPEVTAKAMNKEEINSHVLPFRQWLVHFSPYCHATPQGIQEKYGKHRVIFDSSMQTMPDEVVLNHKTSTNNKAITDFGKAKTHLLANIYNWHISYPNETIYLALANITACFCFPRISADVTGAFGFIAEELYFISTSHVFGSNTSASSWEPLRRAIQIMITVHLQRDNLIIKNKSLLDELRWIEASQTKHKLTKVFPCEINLGVTDKSGNLIPMTANIYVNDILTTAAFWDNTTRIITAVIKKILWSVEIQTQQFASAPSP